MSDILGHTISLGRFLVSVGVICGVLLTATTLYWKSEIREALEVQSRKQEQVEFSEMKKELLQMQMQLTRIEAHMILLTAKVESYHIKE